MLTKLCRDGLLYGVVLYLFEALRTDFDLTRWPVGMRWGLVGVWLLGLFLLWAVHRERTQAKRG